MNPPAQEGRPPAPRAALFCTTFLPYSQTFIWDEIRSHERYAIEVFAWRRRNAQAFPAAVHLARPWYVVTGREPRFDRRFASGGIDIVHAHFGWAGVFAARYARLHGCPLVVSFHGYDVALLARAATAPPRMWPYTLRAASMLAAMQLGLCASAELLNMLASLGVPRQRLVEHRLGVDVHRFRRDPGNSRELQIVMVGRFVEKKGFADGVRAFVRFLQGSARAARLTLVGSGPLESRLRQLVRALGIEPRVAFTGELSHERVARLLAVSDVLLAPSAVARDGDRDSGLMVVKEASACECVPVATRHGGIPDIVEDGVTGYLVPEHDERAMATRLDQLARDPDRRRAMGRAAREKMLREYELRACVRRLEQHYDEAIRRHRPSDKLPLGMRESSPSSQ
jgi:glycosyltransferase involved in cell wall biosynthesis